jgi:hypothetical protein
VFRLAALSCLHRNRRSSGGGWQHGRDIGRGRKKCPGRRALNRKDYADAIRDAIEAHREGPTGIGTSEQGADWVAIPHSFVGLATQFRPVTHFDGLLRNLFSGGGRGSPCTLALPSDARAK